MSTTSKSQVRKDFTKLLGALAKEEGSNKTELVKDLIKVIKSDPSESFKSLEQIILKTIVNFKKLSKHFSGVLMKAIKSLLHKVKKGFSSTPVKKFYFKCVDYFGFYLCSSNFQIKRLFKELVLFSLKNAPLMSKKERKCLGTVVESAKTLAFHQHLRNQEIGLTVLEELQNIFPEARTWMLKIMIESKSASLRKQVIKALNLEEDILKYFILLVRDSDPEIGKLVVEKLKMDRIDFISLDADCRCHILHYGLLSRNPFKRSLFIDYALTLFKVSDASEVHSEVSAKSPSTRSASKGSNQFSSTSQKILFLLDNPSKKKNTSLSQGAEAPNTFGITNKKSDKYLSRLIDIVAGLNMEVCFKSQKMNTLLISLAREIYDRIEFGILQELLISLLEAVFEPFQNSVEPFISEFQEVLFLTSTLLEYVTDFNSQTQEPSQFQKRGRVLFSQNQQRLDRLGPDLQKAAFSSLSMEVDKRVPPFFKYLKVVKSTLLSSEANVITKYFAVDLLKFLSPDEISRKQLKQTLTEYLQYLSGRHFSLKQCYEDMRKAVMSTSSSMYEEDEDDGIPGNIKYLKSPKIKEICLQYFSYQNCFNTKIFFEFDVLGRRTEIDLIQRPLDQNHARHHHRRPGRVFQVHCRHCEVIRVSEKASRSQNDPDHALVLLSAQLPANPGRSRTRNDANDLHLDLRRQQPQRQERQV